MCPQPHTGIYEYTQTHTQKVQYPPLSFSPHLCLSVCLSSKRYPFVHLLSCLPQLRITQCLILKADYYNFLCGCLAPEVSTMMFVVSFKDVRLILSSSLSKLLYRAFIFRSWLLGACPAASPLLLLSVPTVLLSPSSPASSIIPHAFLILCLKPACSVLPQIFVYQARIYP